MVIKSDGNLDKLKFPDHLSKENFRFLRTMSGFLYFQLQKATEIKANLRRLSNAYNRRQRLDHV